MIGFNTYKAPPIILEKMNNLCSVLLQEKKDFEQVAGAIANKDLRSTMLTLAQESNQYASELCSQIHSLGGIPDTEKNGESTLVNGISNVDDEDEILSLCKLNEIKMIGAYREVLNESSLYEGLRSMIRYQLNEMLCGFTLIKQLGALKFHA